MSLDIRQIRHFLAVSERLNFTQAARDCGITQSALTRSIQKLEAQLEHQLFRREGRHTHLTDIARILQPHFEAILERVATATTVARGYQEALRSIRLGVLATLGPAPLAPLLAEFEADNPACSINIAQGPSELLQSRLLSGELDVAILSDDTLPESRVHTVKLYEEHFTAVFRQDHRFAALASVPLAAVAGEALIDRMPGRVRRAVDAAAAGRTMPRHRCEREDWVQSMVLAGMGLAILPETTLLAPGLLARPLTEPELARDVVLTTVAGRRLSAAAQKLVRKLLSATRRIDPVPGATVEQGTPEIGLAG